MKRAIAVFLSTALTGCLATNQSDGRSATGLDAGTRDARGRIDGGHRALSTEDGGDDGDDGGLDPDASYPEYTWVDDVHSIVAAKCDRCHGNPPTEGAPRSIVTYADTQQPTDFGQRLHVLIAARVTSGNAPMPPRQADGGPPPALTPSEKDVIRIWSLIGAPEGPRARDAGVLDAASADGGARDAGPLDTGVVDAGAPDTGLRNPLAGMGPVTQVMNGYQALEAAAWDSAESVLYFADSPGDAIYTLSLSSSVTPYRTANANRPSGLAIDNAGFLLACEQTTRRVSRTLANGSVVTVAGEYMGNTLNSPNDVLVRPSDGMVYFSDPDLGLGARPRELTFNGLFRLDLSTGTRTVEWQAAVDEEVDGLGLSPDERILYVSDYAHNVLYAFDVAASGALSNRRPFVATTPNHPDGIAVDAAGNVFVATAEGITVYAPTGTRWGAIAIPPASGVVTSCTFGGAQLRTLYITSRTTLYSVELSIPGGP